MRTTPVYVMLKCGKAAGVCSQIIRELFMFYCAECIHDDLMQFSATNHKILFHKELIGSKFSILRSVSTLNMCV